MARTAVASPVLDRGRRTNTSGPRTPLSAHCTEGCTAASEAILRGQPGHVCVLAHERTHVWAGGAPGAGGVSHRDPTKSYEPHQFALAHRPPT